jgi:GTP-binding protein
MDKSKIRNLAIVAHVDHGKTTLVDAMLKQSGIFHQRQVVVDRVLDSGELERERGITIMAKNTSVWYKDYKINIVDTPGHADFGGEVERIVRMVDGVLLLVDAFEGPMPQTRFVLQKSLEAGLAPIVVINKLDRPGARPEEVLNELFDLFIELGASDEQIDFPVLYTIARMGIASEELDKEGHDLQPLFETIIQFIPEPSGDPEAPLQVGVGMIDYDSYVGRQAIGRVVNGQLHAKDEVAIINSDGELTHHKLSGLFVFEGLRKVPKEQVAAGDIILVSGIPDIEVGATIASPQEPIALDFVKIDEPTVAMTFSVNKSPFAGQEGEFVTSRKLRERLYRECESDVSLRVSDTDSPDSFVVSGRGELHLSILIETMRRESYEFQVSRPRVITRNIDGVLHEPMEELIIEVPEEHTGTVIESLGPRKGELMNLTHRSDGRVRLTFLIPTRGLFGYRSEFLTSTKGEGIMFHSFHSYAPQKGEIPARTRGSLVAFETGVTSGYGLENAQERGELFVGPGVNVYKEMIVGENSRPGDLHLNVCKKKHLTNMRSSTSDIAVKLVPHRVMDIDRCLEFIADDEVLEITPKSLRMRKLNLT